MRSTVTTSALILGLALAASVGGCASCGHGAETSGAAKPRLAWDPDRVAATPDLALAPPFLFPGERASYRVSLLDVEMADYSFAVGEPAMSDGVRIVTAQTRIQTSGLAARLKSVDNTFTSWIDAAINRPVEFRSEEHEGDFVQLAHTVFAPGQLSVTITDGDKPPVEKIQKTGAGERVFDLNTMYFALRGWDAAEGTIATVHVVRSNTLWRMQVTVGGFESIGTALGELPTIRYDARMRPLTREFELAPGGDERFCSVWITDDESRIPVLMVARTDYGDVRLEIVDYDPGSGVRLPAR
jgi:hypothetical protein